MNLLTNIFAAVAVWGDFNLIFFHTDTVENKQTIQVSWFIVNVLYKKNQCFAKCSCHAGKMKLILSAMARIMMFWDDTVIAL